ncbi:protein ELYS-like [Morus bassanus]
MQELTAQVTSSLLQFPAVTIQAFGEDETTPDSVLRGKFSRGRNGLAWLACGPQLEVGNAVTGERLSACRFSGVHEQPPTIRVVKEFSWQKRTGLLVGLEEAKGSVLCLYDRGTSRVVKAVVLPGRVTAIEPINNPGGASVSPQHLHQTLRWLFGVSAVATDVGHLLLVDLCLDDLSCSQVENEASGLVVATRIPADVPQRREAVTGEGRHLCFQLQNPSGTAISTLCYISRSNQLAVGFSDGYLSLWNMKTLKREHHSQLEGGRIPVYTVTFQEPENDPRNCCYLWAVQSTQEREGDVVSLHLLQLAFGDRKRLASGQVMYEGLECCRERYSLDLAGGVFPLRGQTSNTKLLSCQTVQKFHNRIDREDSVDEVISPDTSVSIFVWQVNTHGQGKPSTYLGVFDINCWCHAQMPDSLRPEESLRDCPYFALWSLDTVTSMTSPDLILDIGVQEQSLSRRVPPSYPPAMQFFPPSTYNFDGTCLLSSGVVHMTCTGFRKEVIFSCIFTENVKRWFNIPAETRTISYRKRQVNMFCELVDPKYAHLHCEYDPADRGTVLAWAEDKGIEGTLPGDKGPWEAVAGDRTSLGPAVQGKWGGLELGTTTNPSTSPKWSPPLLVRNIHQCSPLPPVTEDPSHLAVPIARALSCPPTSQCSLIPGSLVPQEEGCLGPSMYSCPMQEAGLMPGKLHPGLARPQRKMKVAVLGVALLFTILLCTPGDVQPPVADKQVEFVRQKLVAADVDV